MFFCAPSTNNNVLYKEMQWYKNIFTTTLEFLSRSLFIKKIETIMTMKNLLRLIITILSFVKKTAHYPLLLKEIVISDGLFQNLLM